MCCSAKHGHTYHAKDAVTYPANLNEYCKCLGLSNTDGTWKGATDNPADNGECCGAASGSDGFCDRCRDTCVPKLDVVSAYPPELLARGIQPGGIIPEGHEAPMSGLGE